MAERYSPEEIKAYWHQQAIRYAEAPEASWSDRNVIEMEIKEIRSWIRDGDHVLDAGCGNGYSTVAYARSRDIQILGVDYTVPMIEAAGARLAHESEGVRRRTTFSVGDIRSLDLPKASRSCLIATRVLINLTSSDEQLRALGECAHVLKADGRLLLSEASSQGWERLNLFRLEWGLPAIPVPPFNLYFDEGMLGQVAELGLRLVEVRNFSSTYFVATRVLKPLLDAALGGRTNVADPRMHWNRWAAELPSYGDYGTQKLFVFAKA